MKSEVVPQCESTTLDYKLQIEKNNIKKSQLGSQNQQETNTSTKKYVKNVDEEILKSTESSSSNGQSTSGTSKFFYFYQGS